jgi:anti-sigma B factor antagonist
VSSLSVETSRGEASALVALEGELDLSSALMLEDELRRLESDRPRELVLDLSKLRFLDSTGLRLIMAAHMRARKAGRALKIVEGTEAVRRIFRITGVADRLDLVEGVP